MEPGDLILWRDTVWLVRKVDPGLATAVVESSDRTMEVLASDADQTGECNVWRKPAQQWPSAVLPYRCGASRLVDVKIANTSLIRLVSWVKLDDFQVGGALYLNPELRLGYGDRITAVFLNVRGIQVSLPIDIPRDFNPLPARRSIPVASPMQAVAAVEPTPAPKPTPGLFARLKRDG